MLEQAISDVADREGYYGDPQINHWRIAKLMEAYMEAKAVTNKGVFVPSAVDSVAFQIITNLARLMETPNHKPAWENIAGYSGIGYEVTS